MRNPSLYRQSDRPPVVGADRMASGAKPRRFFCAHRTACKTKPEFVPFYLSQKNMGQIKWDKTRPPKNVPFFLTDLFLGQI